MQDKLYYKIGDVCNITNLKPSVLRFWEREFKQLKPIKSNSRHRYYTKQHIELINTLKHLLYEEKLTIEGARLKLKEAENEQNALSIDTTLDLDYLKKELKEILKILK
jgi:DNA-binding transcriptional MerR regulator